MKIILRLCRFLIPHRLAVAAAVLLALLAIAGNMGLLATAGFLIAAAALKPNLLTLSLPMYVVQFLGVTRAFLRYSERLRSHRTTMTLLAEVRVWLFDRFEALAPARIPDLRSGDMLARISADIKELENVYLRAVAPLITAALVTVLVCIIFALFSPVLALTAAAFLLLAGLGVPALCYVLARKTGSEQPALRAALNTQIVDGIQGMTDLLAFGQEAAQQQGLAALQKRNTLLERRMGRISGLRGALNDLVSNVAVLTIVILTIPLVQSGAIKGVYLAFLALLIFSSFEALQPLALAMQKRRSQRGRR